MNSFHLRRRQYLLLASHAALLAACGRRAELTAKQFVGKWRSSRMGTAPVWLHDNGEWEIKTVDDHVLQYGIWELQGRDLIWSIRMNGRLGRDVNAIVSVGAKQFQVRERDGSVTQFEIWE